MAPLRSLHLIVPTVSRSSLLLCVHLPNSLPERMAKKDGTCSKAVPFACFPVLKNWVSGVASSHEFYLGLLEVSPVGNGVRP